MKPPARLRLFLNAQRAEGATFDEAWEAGMKHVFHRPSDWKLACEWAKPHFRDAYTGARNTAALTHWTEGLAA